MDDCTVCHHPAHHHAYKAHEFIESYHGAVTHCVSDTWRDGDVVCECADYRDGAGQTLAQVTAEHHASTLAGSA